MSANAQMTARGDAMYYVHSFLCLLIMFGFGQLPPVEPLTALGMRLIGIFLGLLYGWIFIDIVWPSMAGLLALMLVGGMKPVVLLNRSFGDPIVVMMFFIFVFCATINHYGLSRFISLWFITRKFVAGRPWVFTFTFLASMFILGGLTSASPAAIIGWSILYGICDVCGYKKGDGYPTMMVFGIVFASQVGMSLIPFKQAALTVFSAYETMSGVGIDYAKYMLIAACSCVLCSLLFIALGKYVFKPDMEKLKKLDASKLDTDGALKLSKVQKLILCFLFALVALLLLPNFLPADLFISRFLKSIGNTGICVFLVTVMCFLKVDGKPLLQFKAMIDFRRRVGHHPPARRGTAAFRGHGRAGERDHELPHDDRRADFRRQFSSRVRAVHRLCGHRAHAGHEQRRRRRGPHARHLQLLFEHESGPRTAPHHGRHGRPPCFPDARRQRQRRAPARQ